MALVSLELCLTTSALLLVDSLNSGAFLEMWGVTWVNKAGSWEAMGFLTNSALTLPAETSSVHPSR